MRKTMIECACAYQLDRIDSPFARIKITSQNWKPENIEEESNREMQ